MRSKRWLLRGIIASCFAVPFTPACGNDAFTPATNDASLSDSNTAPDAPSSDANAAPHFCELGADASGHFIVCADFDESDLRTAFTNPTASTIFFSTASATAGGQLFQSDSGFSPPSSLESSIAAVGDASIATVTIGAPSNQTNATHFGLQAELRFNNVGDVGSGSIVIMAFLLSNGATTTSYQLVVGNTGVTLGVLSGKTFKTSIPLGGVPDPADGWMRFRADIALGEEGTVSASLGSTSGSTLSEAIPGQTQPGLFLGASSSGETGSLDLSYDNVLIFADTSFDAGLPDATDD